MKNKYFIALILAQLSVLYASDNNEQKAAALNLNEKFIEGKMVMLKEEICPSYASYRDDWTHDYLNPELFSQIPNPTEMIHFDLASPYLPYVGNDQMVYGFAFDRRRANNELIPQIVLAFPNLTYIDLTGAFLLKDDSLSSLTHLKNLTTLNLNWCDYFLTDNGLKTINQCAKLISLSLYECKKITNEGLFILSGHPTLKNLDVYGCPLITEKGLSIFQEKKPNIVINTMSRNLEYPICVIDEF